MEKFNIGDRVKWNKFQGEFRIEKISTKPGCDFCIIEIHHGFGIFNELGNPFHEVSISELSKL